MMTWLVLVSALNASAMPMTKMTKVTGGPARLEQLLASHRDRLDDARAGRFAERREEVRRALEHAGCAVVLTPRQADLFSGTATRFEDTPDAAFLKDLLSAKGRERKRAYPRLVLNPPTDKEPARQTFNAVFALIEADLRSDFVRMFLSLQRRWPADFVHRLRELAAHGTQGDRIYIVRLIEETGKMNDDQVRRGFHLEHDPEGNLDRIISSNGTRLFGHGFAGAKPDA